MLLIGMSETTNIHPVRQSASDTNIEASYPINITGENEPVPEIDPKGLAIGTLINKHTKNIDYGRNAHLAGGPRSEIQEPTPEINSAPPPDHFVEPQDLHTLSISKAVAGQYGDRTTEFCFTVYFEDSENGSLPADTMFACTKKDTVAHTTISGTLYLDEEGKTKFELKHGQNMQIHGLSLDYKIRIVEEDHPVYHVTFVDSEENEVYKEGNDTGGVQGLMLPLTPARSFHFTNEKFNATKTGVKPGDVRSAMMLIALTIPVVIIVVAVEIILRHRREVDRHNE